MVQPVPLPNLYDLSPLTKLQTLVYQETGTVFQSLRKGCTDVLTCSAERRARIVQVPITEHVLRAWTAIAVARMLRTGTSYTVQYGC